MVGQPSSMSQRCSESAPRCFWTTSTARPSVESRPSHVDSKACSAGLPMRIGGFDQMRSNRTSAGTPSGSATATLGNSLAAAFAAVN